METSLQRKNAILLQRTDERYGDILAEKPVKSGISTPTGIHAGITISHKVALCTVKIRSLEVGGGTIFTSQNHPKCE